MSIHVFCRSMLLTIGGIHVINFTRTSFVINFLYFKLNFTQCVNLITSIPRWVKTKMEPKPDISFGIHDWDSQGMYLLPLYIITFRPNGVCKLFIENKKLEEVKPSFDFNSKYKMLQSQNRKPVFYYVKLFYYVKNFLRVIPKALLHTCNHVFAKKCTRSLGDDP